MGKQFHIRPAQPNDEPAVRACAEDVYARCVYAIGQKPAPMFADFEAEAKRCQAKRITLYTNEKMTQNLSIYPHLGYTEIERRKEAGFHRVYFEKLL